MSASVKRVVYVIAGEASGDAIGSKLIHALKKNPRYELTFRGVGGYEYKNVTDRWD
jgi:lipid A disaccharide synthetase